MSKQREEWTAKDTAECVGMLLLTAGGLLACTGNLSLEDMGVYAQTASELAVPVLAGAASIVLVLAVLLLAVRYLRVAAVAAARNLYLYRRRWASVLDDLGLTETTAKGRKVPRLVSVTRYGQEDVVSVRMLPGQSVEQFAAKAAALADEFGAAAVRVRFGAKHRDLVLVFDRRKQPGGRPMLALPAPQPHPLPLTLPGKHQRQADPGFAIRLTGLRLHIIWARAQRIEKNGARAGRTRYGLRGGIEVASWATAI